MDVSKLNPFASLVNAWVQWSEARRETRRLQHAAETMRLVASVPAVTNWTDTKTKSVSYFILRGNKNGKRTYEYRPGSYLLEEDGSFNKGRHKRHPVFVNYVEPWLDGQLTDEYIQSCAEQWNETH